MLVGDTGVGIEATEKCATNATMRAVEDLDLARIHDLPTSVSSHEIAPLKE
jgi:hypothetical protein